MAKKKLVYNVDWPKITKGSHSTITEHEDGSITFVTDWEALARDVKQAIDSFENKSTTTIEKKKKTKKTDK